MISCHSVSRHRVLKVRLRKFFTDLPLRSLLPLDSAVETPSVVTMSEQAGVKSVELGDSAETSPLGLIFEDPISFELMVCGPPPPTTTHTHTHKPTGVLSVLTFLGKMLLLQSADTPFQSKL